MRHQLRFDDHVLFEVHETLAERLQAAGWSTAAFVPEATLVGAAGFGQGFTVREGFDDLGEDALVERDTGWIVFVAQPDGSVKETPIRLGESVDAWTEVSGGVAAGDQVVILGNERLRDGQSINPQVRELPAP